MVIVEAVGNGIRCHAVESKLHCGILLAFERRLSHRMKVEDIVRAFEKPALSCLRELAKELPLWMEKARACYNA
jgi:hypothetical protein